MNSTSNSICIEEVKVLFCHSLTISNSEKKLFFLLKGLQPPEMRNIPGCAMLWRLVVWSLYLFMLTVEHCDCFSCACVCERERERSLNFF